MSEIEKIREAKGLKGAARLSLFVVSYIPLLAIIIFKQIYIKYEYLNFVAINKDSFFVFLENFGAVTFLAFIGVLGVVGLFLLIKNLERRVINNGVSVEILDIENKNSDSISYLFTYLIPFVSHDLSDLPSLFSFVILFFVAYIIYSNSSMIIINPTLNIKYSLYQVNYKICGGEKVKKGMVISRNRYLEEGDKIKIREMGHKIFYSI